MHNEEPSPGNSGQMNKHHHLGSADNAPAPLTTPPLDAMFQKYGQRYRWLVVLTVMLGTTSMVLATTIVNVVIPDIMAAFHMGQDRAQWLSTGFLAAMSTTMLMTSWCVKAFGQRATYLTAMVLFIVLSLLGGMSNNSGVVIVSRIIQGAAGGIIQPLAMIAIFQVFPAHQRGRAMGIYGLGVVLSPAIGPALGGLLAHYFGWRAVFFVVLPFCLLGAAMAVFFLTGRDTSDERPAFDRLGCTLLVVFTASLLAGLTSGQKTGWSSARTLLLSGTACLACFGFIRQELFCRHPLLNLRIFANRQFSAAAAVSFAYGMGIYGSTYLIPLFVQTICHYTPVRSGLLLFPGGVVLAGAITVAGRLTDRYSAHGIVTAGLACFGVSFYLFAGVNAATTFQTMAWWIVLGRLGLGLVIPALNAGAVQTLKPELLNQGSGAVNFVRQLGGAFGVSMVSSFLDWRSATSYEAMKLTSNIVSPATLHTLEGGTRLQARIAGFEASFMAVAAIFGLALLPAWFMQRKGGHHA
ncbi:MDR family MFS transporter [Geobacter sp. AOG2]|uniref:MDR family MFS transporter n=1 Tax=Geobacter sp. AOG2 TaxID=1566347 RepID=UPI001CC62D22|nr:MDR family MFS transporter [Geobacter sp. AOG2]GFE62424.1 multidrug MFS transporter [Geobacter sp. AOG2]